MSGPLSGIVVLDLTRLQPGNYATLLMGDLGADVIKVEEPGKGDYIRQMPPMMGAMSAAHRVLNRNKKSVTLNLKKPEGTELLHRLVETADVLVESFRPGVMQRLGVSYESLAVANPSLIYAAITGYGQDGPYRTQVGHDINYVAISGVLGATGQAGGPPVLPSVQVADLSGAMMAVVGVLAALVSRGKTGLGEFVDVSMMDASLSWLALHLAPWLAGEPGPQPGEGYLNGGFPFYRVYRCSDDKFVSVGALEPKFWKALCDALGFPELVYEQFPAPQRRAEIHLLLESRFVSRPRDEWVRLLAPLETCVAPVNDFDEMALDMQVLARRMLVEKDLPGGMPWKELGIPLRLLNNPGAIRLPAPGLGEHNSQVYGGIGVSEERLADLLDLGVV
ncbi:MAG: CaiB/BaiF CoA-transferase family protein [Actinomycetota bacterium]